LKTIVVEGGWVNEANEIGLFHANRETDLSQIILIGDASPLVIGEVVTTSKLKLF
jgi:hypothetical protein